MKHRLIPNTNIMVPVIPVEGIEKIRLMHVKVRKIPTMWADAIGVHGPDDAEGAD